MAGDIIHYSNIWKGTFISRPDRFTALVNINGRTEKCHVKNTGRCREILIEGTDVILQESASVSRKTRFDLIAAYKGSRLINIDSQAPNALIEESICRMGIFENISLLKREQVYGASRFDFYVESGQRKAFIEVKGVTLEKNNAVMFPDAPTERGLKHVRELSECILDGYDAYIIFVIQMDDIDYFIPNYEIHAEFGRALQAAATDGVRVLAYDCLVSENSIILNNKVPVHYKHN